MPCSYHNPAVWQKGWSLKKVLTTKLGMVSLFTSSFLCETRRETQILKKWQDLVDALEKRKRKLQGFSELLGMFREISSIQNEMKEMEVWIFLFVGIVYVFRCNYEFWRCNPTYNNKSWSFPTKSHNHFNVALLVNLLNDNFTAETHCIESLRSCKVFFSLLRWEKSLL